MDAAVAWIAGVTALGAGARVLDLGCGPGLYCRRYADLGWEVTGVDFSRSSIEYARGLVPAARFQVADYLECELGGPFDLITMIYGDLCVLSDKDRDGLLCKVSKCPFARRVFRFRRVYGSLSPR